MWTPLGDPEALDNAAARLRAEANHLRDLARRMGPGTSFFWVGHRADRFHARVRAQQASLNHLADDLDRAATRCSSTAHAVRDEIGSVRKVEGRVRNFMLHTVVPAGGLAPWAHTPWSPQHLPKPYSPDWYKLARMLGA